MAVTTKSRISSQLSQLAALAEQLRVVMPHLAGVLDAEDDLVGLNVKAKDDGTCLAVLKRLGSSGAPEVCFGVGYGFYGALFAIDRTVQGGNWKPDKPWSPAAK